MKAILAISGGWLVWGAAFAGIYGLHGLACEIGADQVAFGPVTAAHAMMGAAWLVSMALLGVGTWFLWRAPERLEGGVPRSVGLVSWLAALGALVITGSPILFPAVCA
jgi:hypothetical protein